MKYTGTNPDAAFKLALETDTRESNNLLPTMCPKCTAFFSRYACSAQSHGECDCPKCQGFCTCVWSEYDSAATWCAKRGLKGNVGDPLPANLSTDCLREINNHPDAFAEHVKATAYALAMEQVHAEHGEDL